MADEPSGVEIHGPFRSSQLVINGYNVPCISAHEGDGGRMMLMLDHRIAVEVDATHFDAVAGFVADVIGHCWGYGSHPRGDVVDDPRLFFARVPHPSLAPHRVTEISNVRLEESDD